jgi:hypothetical protein
MTMEAAMEAPAVSCCCRTSQAPTAEDGELQEQSQELGEREAGGGAVGGAVLGGLRLEMGAAPAGGERGHHAHAVDDLGVARHGLRAALGLDGGEAGLLESLSRHGLVGERENEEQDRTAQRDTAHQRVQQEDHGDVDGHPGEVEERQHARRAKKAAAQAEVAQRLHPVGQPAQLGFDGTREAFGCHARLDPGRDTLHHHAAAELQHREDHQSEARQQGQIQQGVQVARRQNAVEHLHHVDRHGKLKNVRHAREQPYRTEVQTAGPEGAGDRRFAHR